MGKHLNHKEPGMHFKNLKESTLVETKDGPGIFIKYQENTNHQNVLVQFPGTRGKRWYKEKHITPIKADIIR